MFGFMLRISHLLTHWFHLCIWALCKRLWGTNYTDWRQKYSESVTVVKRFTFKHQWHLSTSGT